ncbi:F-box LRR-repeat 4 isoform X2, partial [Paramuricea clavata]
LDLSSCIDIPSETFDELAKLTSLKRLNLHRTQITENNFEKIARNLVSLDLWRAKSLTQNGISSIYQNCPNLEEIDLGWCNNVATHSSLRLLVTHCQKMKKIFLTAL